MTKTEFIEKFAEKTGQSKAEAGRSVDAFFALVSETVKKGDKVVFPGVFKAELKERSARTGRNPQTGETINIPAKKYISAKMGDKLL